MVLNPLEPQIDRLNLEGYANLDHWVAELDQRIEGILLARLTATIQLWCTEFDKSEEDVRSTVVLRDITNKRRGDKRLRDDKGQEGQLALKPIIHEIRIQNQVIFLDPPIEYARQTWIKQLHEWLAIVCRQRRIQSSRYEIGLQMQTGIVSESTYTSLVCYGPSRIAVLITNFHCLAYTLHRQHPRTTIYPNRK